MTRSKLPHEGATTQEHPGRLCLLSEMRKLRSVVDQERLRGEMREEKGKIEEREKKREKQETARSSLTPECLLESFEHVPVQ